MTKLEQTVQRTFDLQIPCTCSQPAFCNRYHGLPGVIPEKPDPEQQERFRQLDAIYALGVPHYQSPAAAKTSGIFRECVRPHFSGSW